VTNDQTAFDFNNELPAGLDGEGARVARILLNRRGKARAISRRELVAITGIPDRRLRSTIASLVIDHHLPIGSAAAGGYFWMTSLEEIKAEARNIESYLIDIAARKRALEAIARDRFAAGYLFKNIDKGLQPLEENK